MTAQPVYTADPLEAFYRHLRGLGRSEGTIRQYRVCLERATAELAGAELLDLGPAELRRLFTMSTWIQELSIGVKGAYAGRVAAYLEWAAEEEFLEVAPTGPLRKWMAALGSEHRDDPPFLTMDETARLEAAFWDHSRHPERDTAVLWVMAGAGGRITETLKLHRNDVSLTDETIRFRHDTKGGRKRTVDMTPPAKTALRRWVHARVAPEPWLFGGWDGKPIGKTGWEQKLHRIAATVQDPPIQWALCPTHGEGVCEPGRGPGQCPRARWRVHPHTFRHTFAVEALRSGACTLVELRDILGHSSIATTNIYAHVVGDESSRTRFRRRFGKGRG